MAWGRYVDAGGRENFYCPKHWSGNVRGRDAHVGVSDTPKDDPAKFPGKAYNRKPRGAVCCICSVVSLPSEQGN